MDELLQLDPNDVPALMSLAQLSSGVDAKARIDHVIAIQPSAEAYLALAELYLTDLCMETDAESRCREAIEKSIELDPNHPDTYMTFGSFWISKCDLDSAMGALRQSLNLWIKLDEYPNMNHQSFQEIEWDQRILNENMPSYASRLSMSKLLIECGSTQLAYIVLNTLLQQDEDVLETWYLLGLVYWMEYQTNKEEFALEGCNEALEQCVRICTLYPNQDEEVLIQIQEMKDTVTLHFSKEEEEEAGMK